MKQRRLYNMLVDTRGKSKTDKHDRIEDYFNEIKLDMINSAQNRSVELEEALVKLLNL